MESLCLLKQAAEGLRADQACQMLDLQRAPRACTATIRVEKGQESPFQYPVRISAGCRLYRALRIRQNEVEPPYIEFESRFTRGSPLGYAGLT